MRCRSKIAPTKNLFVTGYGSDTCFREPHSSTASARAASTQGNQVASFARSHPHAASLMLLLPARMSGCHLSSSSREVGEVASLDICQLEHGPRWKAGKVQPRS